jgi:uncharacterized protein YcsI (UPF0317 family)
MRRCDDICAFTVCCLFLLFCEKSPKTLPFLLPFSRKGQTEEKLHERKELFSLRDDCEYREEYTEEEEEEREKRRRERDRSLLLRKRSG